MNTTVKKVTSEPHYIKVYSDHVVHHKDLIDGLNPLLNILVVRMTDRNVLNIDDNDVMNIAEEMEAPEDFVTGGIDVLVSQDILIKQSSDRYLVNPFMFGKGEWSDNYALRTSLHERIELLKKEKDLDDKLAQIDLIITDLNIGWDELEERTMKSEPRPQVMHDDITDDGVRMDHGVNLDAIFNPVSDADFNKDVMFSQDDDKTEDDHFDY